jgi:hypothetical protein
MEAGTETKKKRGPESQGEEGAGTGTGRRNRNRNQDGSSGGKRDGRRGTGKSKKLQPVESTKKPATISK